MMKSMTGYGKAIAELPEKKVTIEVRSLNSKQLDLNLRIPGIYREKEHEIRSEISKQLERGKIDLSFFVEYTGVENTTTINKTLAKAYYKELNDLSTELKLNPPDLLSAILKMPEVVQAGKTELTENEWKTVKSSFLNAINSFNTFRIEEGKALSNELKNRINNITEGLQKVESFDKNRINTTREKIKKNILEFVSAEKMDQNRFEQELIYYIEKFDITEETVRLKTHCDHFLKTMTEDSSGRKLGFIAQEIGREINTIGSKANDASIQSIVVSMKDELEKVKEQLLNIL